MLLCNRAFNLFLIRSQYELIKVKFVELTIAGYLNHPILMFSSVLIRICTEYGNPTYYFTKLMFWSHQKPKLHPEADCSVYHCSNLKTAAYHCVVVVCSSTSIWVPNVTLLHKHINNLVWSLLEKKKCLYLRSARSVSKPDGDSHHIKWIRKWCLPWFCHVSFLQYHCNKSISVDMNLD